MKRITLIILAVMALLAGSVSCSKINDIDKRLSDVEDSLSQLEAQIAAGAYITSVETAADGVSFTLSNGKTYKVTNGKDGSDGEAIIADVKIEEDFVVLTLKNGETLSISYQNPLSMVTLNIIPDYSDGSVYSYSDDGSFFLRVSVTPKTYIDKLINNDGLICKADFRSVITKAVPEDPDFTVVGEITSGSAEEGYMTTYFELTEDEIGRMWESDYVVSFSLEDTDGVHGVSTPFVPVSCDTREGEGGDKMEAVDMGLSVMWAKTNLGARDELDSGNRYMWGGTKPVQKAENLSWSNCPFCVDPAPKFSKYGLRSYPQYWGGDGAPDGRIVLEAEDDAATQTYHRDWRMPTKAEFQELINNCDKRLIRYPKICVMEYKSKINGKSIIFPYDDKSKEDNYYWASSLNLTKEGTRIYIYPGQLGYVARYNAFHIRPVYGPRKVANIVMDVTSLQLDMYSTSTLKASVYPAAAADRSVTWSSSDSNVASVDAQGNVTGVSAGEATITVKTNDGGFTATCKVTVVIPSTKAVDLGLSVKWANMNLGAYAPEMSGDYYAWGATAPNPGGNYSWSKCPYCSDGYGEKFSKYVPMGKMSYWGGSGSPDNKRKLEPGDDAAAAKLGGKWRTPTSAEFEELFKSCDTEWTTVNDVNGLKFTSRTNGNSIFLPATGHRNGSSLYDAGEEGLYMSSSLATDIPDHSESLKLSSIGARGTTVKRNCGLAIRAVTE